MLCPDSASRRDMITDVAIGLILTGGAGAVSVQAVGHALGISRQAVQQWLGDTGGSRASVLEVVTTTFGWRWADWIERRSWDHAGLALLPATVEEVGWTRVLLALQESTRVSPSLAAALDHVARRERELLPSVHPSLEDRPHVVEHLLTLVDGWRMALCRPINPVQTQVARSALWAECERLAGPLAPGLASYAPWALSHSLLARKQGVG